jgi:hypothetical protein
MSCVKIKLVMSAHLIPNLQGSHRPIWVLVVIFPFRQSHQVFHQVIVTSRIYYECASAITQL